MTRIAFLCSGGGGNFHFVRDCLSDSLIPGAYLLPVLSDRNGPVTQWCKTNGHPYQIVDFTLEKQSETLLPIISEFKPDIIVTNIARIISPEIVRTFEGKMINLHYSLLPAFAGTIGFSASKISLSKQHKFCGVTAHFVSEEVDAGRQIGQAAIPVRMSDIQIDGLGDVIFRCGALLLISAISAIAKGLDDWSDICISIHGRTIFFNSPETEVARQADTEARWARVKQAVQI